MNVPHASVGDALAAILEQPRAQWETALEQACRRDPARGDALRARFRELLALGDDWTPDAAAIPERIGRYRLRERIGGGGMGVVYRATDEAEREVALKLVRPEHLYFPGARERFRREVDACIKLRHDGIVAVHEFGEAEEIPYFAMELVQGLDLGRALAALGARDPASLSGKDLTALLPANGSPRRAALAVMSWPAACADLVRQAALAVEHAHAHGVVHRDLKPGNLMLEADGRMRVLDFGLSLREGVSRLTRTGAVVGSLPYTAPEVLAGGEGNRRVDVYGLGVTLYELLTLHSPFLTPDPERTRRRILDGSYAPIARANPAVPRELETVCMKAMDVDPAQRYATAQLFASDLRRAMALLPIAARRPGPVLLSRRFVRRHPTASAALALGSLLVVGTPTVLLLQSRAHLADVTRLADELVIDDLVTDDEKLWPAVPEHAEAMADWIARAGTVLARQPVHEASLERLRRQALPRTEAEEAADRERWQAIVTERETESATLAAQEEKGFDRASSRAFAAAADRLAELALAQERASWRFPDDAMNWQHTRLSALLGKLRQLPPRVQRMQQRLEFARTIVARSLEEPREAWAAACAAIAKSPVYHGLALQPQRGLVPLGPDSDSGLWEFAHLTSGAVPLRDPATGKLRISAEDGIVLVLLPAGEFTMGADPIAPRVGAGDQGTSFPPNIVKLDAFFLAKHEMTQAQWFRATGDNPSEITPAHSPSDEPITLLHPVENVSWNDCQRTLSRLDLQLPTEARWEYGARGGTTTRWWSGPDGDSLEGCANVRDAQYERAGFPDCAPFEDKWVLHAPVGSYRANPFGLYDVLGNVAEWVLDTFAEYTEAARPGDGARGSDKTQTNAVYRGGAYMDPLKVCSVTYRKKDERTNRWSYIGVRPARRIDG
jgi:serine/threonine protein kinase/formylglycine-generating enzyme required for sulfatase activity